MRKEFTEAYGKRVFEKKGYVGIRENGKVNVTSWETYA
jgi:hypothetical protein